MKHFWRQKSDVSFEATVSLITAYFFFNVGYFTIQTRLQVFIAAHLSGDIYFHFHRTDFFNLKNILYILDRGQIYSQYKVTEGAVSPKKVI